MRRLLFGIVCFIVLCATIVLSVELVVFDQGFYEHEYTKLRTADNIGISSDDLMDATNHLLAYVRNEKEDLSMRYEVSGMERQLFNQREIDHMVDVKELYLKARNIRRVGMVLLGALLFLIIRKPDTARKKQIYEIASSMVDALMIMIILVVFLGGFYLVNFDLFWTTFHELVFTNDLWLLDPRTDILIQMVPTQFFIDCVGRIMLYSGIFLTIILGLAGWSRNIKAHH